MSPDLLMIDTCIVIDYLENRGPAWADETEALLSLDENQCTLCITAKAITDLFYILHRFFHDKEKAKAVIEDLLGLFRIVGTEEADVVNALGSPIGDYEDAVMEETAFRIGADYIITRNTADYRNSRIPVLSAGEYVKREACR